MTNEEMLEELKKIIAFAEHLAASIEVNRDTEMDTDINRLIERLKSRVSRLGRVSGIEVPNVPIPT